MSKYLEEARNYVNQYRDVRDDDNKIENLLVELSEDDLAVLEELLKIILDQENWIKDTKDIISRGR